MLLYFSQEFSAQYIDDFEELPFDIDSSRRYVERLIIASAPWQSWAMSVRAVVSILGVHVSFPDPMPRFKTSFETEYSYDKSQTH